MLNKPSSCCLIMWYHRSRPMNFIYPITDLSPYLNGPPSLFADIRVAMKNTSLKGSDSSHMALVKYRHPN